MNKKGQSLVLFVLIIPLLVGVFAFVIDTGLAYYNKSKISGSIESNLEIILEKKIYDKEKIKEVIIANIDYGKIDIENNRTKIYIRVQKENNYVFTHLLSQDKYVEYSYCGDYNTGLISFNEECL